MKMMKCCVLIGLLAFICACFGSLAMAEAYVTKADILQKTGFTEKDVEAVDIDQFIQDEQITPELHAALTEDDVREAVQTLIDRANVVSHVYLFAQDALAFADFDMESEQLLHIAVVSTNDALLPSLLIDFEQGIAYFSNGNLFADISAAEKVTTLDDELIDAITDAINAANVNEWAEVYEGDASEDYYYYESIAIQTDKGIYRYEKNGIESDAPESTTDLMLALYRMFWE